MELLLYLKVKTKYAVKLARETREILHCAAFFSFLEKLESWLDRLNAPLLQVISMSNTEK